jgi:hypothetical protein
MLTRIGILGLGGWWLFWRTIGESLCRIRSIEIVFIARGETKKQLQSQD